MFSTSSSLNSFTRDQLPGAGLKRTCTRTASTYRYPNIRASDLGPAWVRSAHCVRKFSLNFHRSGAPQLDVIGYLSFDRPRRSVLGPPGRWRDLIRVRVRFFDRKLLSTTSWTSQPRKRANFALKFSSRDALWKPKPRRLRVYRVSPY